MYTLVQHSGYTYSGKPGFDAAVELRSVTTAQEKVVKKVGGLLFKDYDTASEREYDENFPPEVEGMYPEARGSFAKSKITGQNIYIPRPITKPELWDAMNDSHIKPETKG